MAILPASTPPSPPWCMSDPSPILIQDDDALRALADELVGIERLAADTEFHAERRYHPALALLQLATRDRSWAIDPLACDLRPLAPVIEAAELLVHGGRHDLALIRRATGAVPRSVVDTQRLAALLGYGYPRRLDDVVVESLGIAPPPALTLSDWFARPLTPDALRYAAADVLLLWPLVDHLGKLLGSLGREGLAASTSCELLDSLDAPPRDPDAWRGWDVAPHLGGETRAVLAALLRWRNDQAAKRDQPPHYLLGDSLALALARMRPRDVATLRQDRRIGDGLRKRHGSELVEVVRRALAGPVPSPVTPEEVSRRGFLRVWADAWGTPQGLAPQLLMPDAVLRAVAEHGPDALQGWRRDLMHGDLMAAHNAGRGVFMLAGRLCVLANRSDVIPRQAGD